MTLKAQINWTDGLQFVARANNGPAVVIDSSDGGSGASPMELLLIGVAGCTAIDVIMIMQKKRADIVDFKVNISGERAEDHPQRYTQIHIEYVLSGRDIKANAVEQAIQLSETKYCSASASLNADIDSTYRIVEAG
jgi:putative redox protein